jgi:hypothetical protein
MSKYQPLQDFLENSRNRTEVLTFAELETILGFPLPDSASTHRPWWANGGGHPQAKAWLDAGWKVESVSLGFQVTFSKSTNEKNRESQERNYEREKETNRPRMSAEFLTTGKPQGEHATANIVLISCVSQKRDYRTRAENMYTSTLFTKSLQYAKEILRPDKIFILSAKYGLLPLDKKIDPYNLTLNDMSSREREKWAATVLQQLKLVCDIANAKFIFLAGKNYYENLIAFLPNQNCEIKMDGLPIGKRLQWLGNQLAQGGN